MALAIRVFTTDGCGECVRTTALLNRKNITFQTVHVAQDNTELIEALRRISDVQGIALIMPMVEVVNEDLGEKVQWFGHRPDQVLEHIINSNRRTW